MLDEPDLFISLNNTCNTVNSVNSVNSIKRDGTLRHTCASSTLGSAGSSVQLHDIQCIPSYNGGGYGPDHRSVKSRVLGINVGDIKARKWYLVVILLLYIGLITSFCLNISLLLRTYPKPNESSQTMNNLKSKGILQDESQAASAAAPATQSSKREYVYSTACLVEDPCEAGNYYSCSARSCLPCDLGTFQPVWGQTSCWSCPPNTTTDQPGSSSPTQCKHTACVHHSRPGLAILQSPNYPGSLPSSTNCHWRVEPGTGVSVLLILPALSLPPDCSHTLSVRRGSRLVFSSCQSTDGPRLVTSQGSGEMWVDFKSSSNMSSSSFSSSLSSPSVVTSSGFQLSLVSVSEDMRHVIDTVTNTYNEYNEDISRHNNMADQQLVRHIIKLLSAKVGNDKILKAAAIDLPKITGAGESSLITVVEEKEPDYPSIDNDQFS